MKWLTFEIQREPGFRFNLLDLVLILLLAGLSGWLYQDIPGNTVYLAPLYLGLSFFLFCNVFRIGNRLEPLWYVPFTLWSAYCFYYASDMGLYWQGVLFGLEPLKWCLIGYRVVKGSYHGAFCKRTT